MLLLTSLLLIMFFITHNVKVKVVFIIITVVSIIIWLIMTNIVTYWAYICIILYVRGLFILLVYLNSMIQSSYNVPFCLIIVIVTVTLCVSYESTYIISIVYRSSILGIILTIICVIILILFIIINYLMSNTYNFRNL